MTDAARIQRMLLAWQRIDRALVQAVYATSQEWLGFELSIAKRKALSFINDSEEVTVSALAARLGATLPTASVLADRLAKGGLVLRAVDEKDRRRVLLRLSRKGKTLVTRVRGRPHLARWMAHLSALDRETLDRSLEALAAAAESATPVTEAASGAARVRASRTRPR